MTRLNLTTDELLTTTRAVRKRLDLDRPVERDVLEECLYLATQAPTGRNRQRWAFMVVTDPKKRAALADLYRKGLMAPTEVVPEDGIDRRDDPAQIQRGHDSGHHLFRTLHRVPVLLIPCVHIVRGDRPGPVDLANSFGSILPAAWSFMLAARERGLGTVWTTPHLQYEREAADLLDIPYDTVLQTALIPVAYTIGTSFRPAARTDLDNVAHWDTW
ncbi:nitroreductase family protein [Nocardia nova]|uniref:nitroreductase family protein n=1 Tax=Nocardia nova TaxID=37330 RepID=UPI00046D6E57